MRRRAESIGHFVARLGGNYAIRSDGITGRSVCLAVQPPATPAEVQYLRFLLLNVASLDHSPDAIKSYEDSLVRQFGLASKGSAAIHAAGQTLKPLLAQLRNSSRAIVAGRSVLLPVDSEALANLNAQREERIVNLANQILNSVSPAVADRLRVPGHIVANVVKKN
jgi:hypothetical protein